ncbi:MAG: hypothetical protein KA116_12575, partial [Proteobacteria bacterium]|nr:hypothetical protein [Pseudomonadota bacterium]
MGSKYSIFFLAAISLTASAEWVDPSNTLGLASVIANNLVKGVPATDSYYSPKSGRNSVDSKRPDTHGLDNKPLEGDRNQTVFGYTIGGGSGSYSASAVGFGSTSSSGGGGQVNLGGGAQSDLNPANQIGGGNTISRGVASASNSGSGYSDGVSPSYNNGSNTSVPGVNFPPATTTSSNSANQIGGTPEPSTINTQSTTQNLGSQTPTFETLFKP